MGDEQNSKGDAALLRDLGKRYQESFAFQPGDLVQWKRGMRNKTVPAYGNPAVVLEIVPGRRDENADVGRLYCGENNELRLGMLDRDGDLLGFWVDAHRFEPYSGE